MIFNSYIFILFFLPITLIGYFILSNFRYHKIALIELIIMSFLFYAYNNVKYVFILVTSIVVNWLVACLMYRCRNLLHRKYVLISGILVNIGIIFYFKYFNFFIENFNYILRTGFNLRNIVLPLGISFFTFQQISYLVDSYREETRQYSFLEYTAFVSFFPQLVAGPIVLHSEIIPQFKDSNRWKFNHDSFANGFYAFSIGLFKKVMIADTFGQAVSWGWSNLESLAALEIFIVMLSYTLQIYFDFSGYCDMAFGIGKMFNIDLPINFNSPYKALSIIEFWDRWHITLNRFLRTYIYFPLGGSRKGKLRTYINVMIVFIISGIWHGANWTFVLWGLIHGFGNVLNRIFMKTLNKVNAVIRWCWTFAFVNIAWLFFRADNIWQALDLIKRMFSVSVTSFHTSAGLEDSFKWSEVVAVVENTPLHSFVADRNYIYMFVMLGLGYFICLGMKNLYEQEFKPTLAKAIIAPTLLVWSILSLTKVSTFLYFNF